MDMPPPSYDMAVSPNGPPPVSYVGAVQPQTTTMSQTVVTSRELQQWQTGLCDCCADGFGGCTLSKIIDNGHVTELNYLTGCLKRHIKVLLILMSLIMPVQSLKHGECTNYSFIVLGCYAFCCPHCAHASARTAYDGSNCCLNFCCGSPTLMYNIVREGYHIEVRV